MMSMNSTLRRLIVHEQPKSPIAEAYRMLAREVLDRCPGA